MRAKHRTHRLLRITLTAVLILSSFCLLTIPARAATPTYEMSGAYTDSVFYDELTYFYLIINHKNFIHIVPPIYYNTKSSLLQVLKQNGDAPTRRRLRFA
jgi:hypothetical protein